MSDDHEKGRLLYINKNNFCYISPSGAVSEFTSIEAAHLADLITSALFNYHEDGDEVLEEDT